MKPLTRIDKYIIQKFLGTYFFCLLLIIVIVIMFDITEKLDDFHKSKASTWVIITRFYLNFIPYFVNLFSALFTFISVIFFTSKLASNTEIVALLASGISYNRIIRPYLFASVFIGIITFVLASYIIPPANKNRLMFEQKFIQNSTPPPVTNIHIELEPEVFVYMNKFASSNKQGTKFSLEKFEKDRLISKLTAEVIIYDTLDIWQVKNYLKREILPIGEKVTQGDTLTLHLAMKPDEFISSSVGGKASQDHITMNNNELRDFINKQDKRGVGNTATYIIELQKRYASAFASIILTFIGVFIASRKVRGGIGLHIMMGLGLSFGYILFSTVSVSFATAGNMDPRLAVWLPNIIFSFFALFLFFKAQK